MPDQKDLEVMDQKSVTFYGDDLIAIQAEDGQIYVALRKCAMLSGLITKGKEDV